ncbi:hypothetical protein [Planctomyces sp. SH-PL14]|uniref:hypothetical protein n=1 Tax=Planctomyces sp. SH-PL14 TaxID=1632864 RepID=UPI00078D054F|nr:hypothetical protein [Planctomyces sp. SH-PL14]AMV18201.1 hypothetical protein VT03_09955 [Planctomyces sp. SH-PL14]
MKLLDVMRSKDKVVEDISGDELRDRELCSLLLANLIPDGCPVRVEWFGQHQTAAVWLVGESLRSCGQLLPPEDPADVWDRQAAAHVNAERVIGHLSRPEVRGHLLQHWDEPSEVVWSCWERATPPHWLPVLVREAQAVYLRRVARYRINAMSRALEIGDDQALRELLTEVAE